MFPQTTYLSDHLIRFSEDKVGKYFYAYSRVKSVLMNYLTRFLLVLSLF